jgi:hypothetical protein
MVTRVEWYSRVNREWPEHVPPLTAEEAIRAAKKLYRFAKKRVWRGAVRVVTGNRQTWVYPGEIAVNPQKGWRDLVHLLSHALYQGLKHGGAHARAEIRFIKEVKRRGWLEGNLKTKPKPVAPPPDPVTAKQAAWRAKLAHARALKKGWETKAKRAATAIRKYNASIRAYERLLGTQP